MPSRFTSGRIGFVGGSDGFAFVGKRFAFEAQWGLPVWWAPRFTNGAVSPSGRVRGVMVGWLLLALRFGKVVA